MPKKSEDCGRVEVRASAVHGRGVFASEAIEARSLIGRYRGRRFRAVEGAQADPAGAVYLFGLSDGSYIDGAVGGNATRFINHSCKPNCVAVEVRGVRGAVLGVDIHALEFIGAGQELFLDYRLEVAESDFASYACHCGISDCRGTMAAVG
jgi:SET domain-containing protein